MDVSPAVIVSAIVPRKYLRSKDMLVINRVLIDSGALAGNYISRRFVEDHRTFLKDGLRKVTASVQMADGREEKITEELNLELLLQSYEGDVWRKKSLQTTFLVSDLQGVDAIIGLPTILHKVFHFFVGRLDF